MRKKYLIHLAVIAAVSVIVMGRQLFPPRVFSCVIDDTVWYLNWSGQFADSLMQGNWYPRWAAGSHTGYGSPTFLFYPPLVIYLTATLDAVTRDVMLSACLVKFAGLLLSGVFMYVFISDLYGGKAGLAAAVMYMVLPYRVYDLYVLGMHAGRFAYALYPIILYFTHRAVAEGRPGTGFAGLAASYAALCLAHLISAFMFSPVVFFFGLVSAGRGRLTHGGVRVVLACFLGLSLAGIYLIPFLLESRLVHMEAFLDHPWAKYYNNYVFHVFTPVSPLNQPYYPDIRKTVVWSVLIGLAAYLSSRPFKYTFKDHYAQYFILIVVSSLFLMSSLSGPLWATAPGLKVVQFTNRWAGVMVFGLACLAGTWYGRMKKSGVLFIVLLTAAFYYDTGIMKKACPVSGQDLTQLPAAYDVQEYVPRGVSLKWLGETWLRPPDPRVSAVPQGKYVKVDINRWRAEDREFSVIAEGDTTLRISTFNYPGWHAAVDGIDTAISAEPVTGAMLVEVPAGAHHVRLAFSDTPVRTAGKYCSVIAGALILFIIGKSCIKKASTV